MKTSLNFILFLCGTILTDAQDPIVQLPKGKIQGHILKSENGSDYYAFQEIPYAAPPTGSSRFKVPKEPDAWTSVLNATKNTVVCYQSAVQYANLKNSEDCLYINVYTPVQPGSNASLPVLAWVHGGGYAMGSGTYEHYGPKYIIDHGVVVVAFNYRLGPFGFLTTEDDVIPANLGMKDQMFALMWIQENIGLFGGNSSHVTLLGQSAGSGAVGLHLIGPWDDGKELFHAAVMQSGSPMWPSLNNAGKLAAIEVARSVDSNLTSENSTDLLRVLQNASAEVILKANHSASWGPLVEAQGHFSYPPLEAFISGNFKKVPLLIGFNSEEALAFASGDQASAESYDVDPSLLVSDLLNVTDRKAVGQQLRNIYTNASFKENFGDFIRFSSDNSFTTPSLKQAVLESNHTNVYLYQFSYKGELGMEMQVPQFPGAGAVVHGEDLKYMWDDQSNSDLSKFPEADRLTLHRYVKLWTNFIKYYNPTPEKDDLLQNITWQKLDPNKLDEISYLNINVTFDIRTNPRQFQQVKKVLDENILPPYNVY